MRSDLWSYSGESEYVSLRLKPIYPSSDGGYVIFIHLVDGRTWIFSSSDPGRCIANWNNTTKKYDLPTTKLVMISQPFILYTAVKNKIVERLEPYQNEGKKGFQAELNTIIQEAEVVMEMAIHAIQDNGRS